MSRKSVLSVVAFAALASTCGSTYGAEFVGPGGVISQLGSTGFDLVISGTDATVGSVNSVTVTNIFHSSTGYTSISLYRPLTPQTGISVFLTADTHNVSSSDTAQYNGTYTFLVDPTLKTFREVALATNGPVPSGTYAMQSQGNLARTNFSEFANLPLDGTWTLLVHALTSAGTPSLGSWTLNVTPVPEPVSGVCLLAGLPLLLRRRSR